MNSKKEQQKLSIPGDFTPQFRKLETVVPEE